jgi:non-heme chloroperoxidase
MRACYSQRPRGVWLEKESGHGPVTTKDGTKIFYKDWGEGQPVVLSHGWPLTADAWDAQMVFLGNHGYRVIAHDRRSHGRSDQTWDGNDMNTYADDLAAVIDALDLRDIVLIGHTTGAGEVAHYIGRHGTRRVAKAVLVSAVPPLMLKTAANPEGLPIEAFDALRKATFDNRAQFYKDLALPFFGYNRPRREAFRRRVRLFLAAGHVGRTQRPDRLHPRVLRS